MQPLGLLHQRIGIRAALFEQRPDNALPLPGEGHQQVQGVNRLALALIGQRLGALHRFLRFLGQLVESNHLPASSPPLAPRHAGESEKKEGGAIRPPSVIIAPAIAGPTADQPFSSTRTWRGLAVGFLGRLTVSTPL